MEEAIHNRDLLVETFSNAMILLADGGNLQVEDAEGRVAFNCTIHDGEVLIGRFSKEANEAFTKVIG